MLNHLWSRAGSLSHRTPKYLLRYQRQPVRGPGIRAKGAALNCRRTHLGAGGLLTRHSSAVLWPPGDEQAANRGGQLSVLWKKGQRVQQSGTADVWLEGNWALREKPAVGLPLSAHEGCCACTQHVYFWLFCDRNQTMGGGKGLQIFWAERSSWVLWDATSSGELKDLLPAISLHHLMDYIWSKKYW